MYYARMTFSYTHSIETDASAGAIWSLYEDVTSWPEWDAEAEEITRDGPFATGTTGTMKFAGQGLLRYRLTRVEPLNEWIDETAVDQIVVHVAHRLEPLAGGRLRLTYAAEIDGPEEQTSQIGPAITADFPDTMQALVALAKERSR